MTSDTRRIVLIGTGFVGMSYVYSMLNQGVATEELVLIDIDKNKAEGEAMDLNHGLAFSPKKMKIWAGDYSDCKDADIVVISAGSNQKPGETRLDLLQRNANIFRSITRSVMASEFNGIFLIASNPVDIMSYVVYRESGLPKERVIGSGTTLDTARLRYMIADKIDIDPRNIHGYVMGEHGDTEFIPWSLVTVGVKPIKDVISDGLVTEEELTEIEDDVRNAAYKIIERKQATYYGIGMALTRITNAILGGENSILTVSSLLAGEYGIEDVYLGVPCIVTRNGIKKIIELNLNEDETKKLNHSAKTLKENISHLYRF